MFFFVRQISLQMFHKYNSLTNTLSPSDQLSAYVPESFGTKEATNNFFVAPQPKGRHSTGPVASIGAVLAEKASTVVAQSHEGHGHGHAQPWEGVNLWRTPFKGDTDTITQVKKSKGTLDQYVENRTRRIQQLQLFALKNKSTPTWILMPRDKIYLGVQALIAGYVLFQVGSTVYNHLKAKDRLKLLKLIYKDNVN